MDSGSNDLTGRRFPPNVEIVDPGRTLPSEEVPRKSFRGTFFRLHYPTDWECEIIENVPSFFDPDAGWALQIAATRNASGDYDLRSELRTYLENNSIEFMEERVVAFETQSGLTALACEFTRENRFWMIQFLGSEDRMVIMIFNADEVPDHDLAIDISRAVGSLEFF